MHILLVLLYSTHLTVSERMIGQEILDYKDLVGHDEIRHWQRYAASNDFLYVVNFNYLLNGIEIDRIEVAVPDPLNVINRQVPDLYFSLVYWRSSKLYEDLEGTDNVLLTVSYKLKIYPGRDEFLWNEMTGKLLIPCIRLGCPKIPPNSYSYYYLGWIIYSTVVSYEPISFVVKDHHSPLSLVYEEARAYDIDVETSRTFHLGSSERKLRLVTIYYNVIGAEIAVSPTPVPATSNLAYSVNFELTACHAEGHKAKPFLVVFLLLESNGHEEEHHQHYLTMSPTTYDEFYDTLKGSTGSVVTVVISQTEHAALVNLADQLESKLDTMLVRMRCINKDTGEPMDETTPKPPKTCTSNELVCSNEGRCSNKQCECKSPFSGPQCTIYEKCNPNSCQYDWLECTMSSDLQSDSQPTQQCKKNPYYPILAKSCTQEADCENILFARCANGSCVCNPGYVRNSTIVQSVRQEKCIKQHALCERDTQCHYIDWNMICTSEADRKKKCYCSVKNQRDVENGLCRQFGGSNEGFEWKSAYTVAVIAGAVCIFLMCVALVVADHRQSNKNSAQRNVIKRTFDHVIELERELSSLATHKHSKSNTRRSKHDHRRGGDAADAVPSRRRYSMPELDGPLVERYRLGKSRTDGGKIRSKLLRRDRDWVDDTSSPNVDPQLSSDGLPNRRSVRQSRSRSKRKYAV